ncbi:peptide chain release factor N(5)-glutamine methyltransferase [bacterium]|nr:peptide chain release factor N(5)-glutamine methyltransferase [bacterium]
MKQFTYKQALIYGSKLLKKARVDEPILSARLLLQYATSLNHTSLLATYHKPILRENFDYYKYLLKRRARHEPLPYILGYHYFMDFMLLVKPGVFIPRPETETLVEVAIKKLSDKEGLVIDIGTGTGAIAIGIARFRPKLRVLGIDINRKAIALARQNARLNGVGDRVEFRYGNVKDAKLPPAIALVSNPPYIASSHIPKLPIQIRLYEPYEALNGGEDGLDLIKVIIERGKEILLPGGFLILEVGEGQSETVKDLLLKNGYWDVEVYKDLLKIERVVAGIKK